ncbi:unnamed protein product, partial [marine sediment metagenome]
MKKAFYPFLFAMFPTLSLFAYNISEVREEYLLLPIAISLAMTAGVFFTLRLITKNYEKSGLLTL